MLAQPTAAAPTVLYTFRLLAAEPSAANTTGRPVRVSANRAGTVLRMRHFLTGGDETSRALSLRQRFLTEGPHQPVHH